MALTPEQEAELAQLEQEHSSMLQQYEELKKQFAPKEPEYQAESSYPEAFARGAAQTIGFPEMADEATAWLEHHLTGKPQEQALKESRAEYKKSEEEYPVTTFLGNLAGAVGQTAGITAATAGLGTAAATAPHLQKLHKGAELLKSLVVPKIGPSAMSNIANAAKVGALMGGASEFGASEKSGFEALKEVPGGVIGGGIVGGALGGLAEGAGKVGKKVIEKIEAGETPYSFKKILDLYRSGMQGQGYSTVKSENQLKSKFMDAAEQSVDLIQNSVDDIRQIRQAILSQVPDEISVKNPITSLLNELSIHADEQLSDAEPALRRVKGIFEGKKSEDGTMSLVAANDIVGKLEDYVRSQDGLSEPIKKAFRKTINDIKTEIRLKVPTGQARQIISSDPELAAKFEKYADKMPLEEAIQSDALKPDEKDILQSLSDELKKQGKEPYGKLEPEVLAQLDAGESTTPKIIKTYKNTPENKKIEDQILDEARQIRKEAASQEPIGILDAMMHNIMNASENLGGVLKSDADDLRRTFKLYDVMRGNTANTGSGEKAVAKYNAAVEELQKAHPELAEQFKQITQPRITELENKKFLEGSKLGEGSRDVGVVKQFLSAPAAITGSIANIAGQVKGAARRGAAGPIPLVPTSTILKPAVTVLQMMKDKIDDNLTKDPSNVINKTFSEALKSAIEQQDEGRRAAILKTLMSYESFRRMFRDDKYNK